MKKLITILLALCALSLDAATAQIVVRSKQRTLKQVLTSKPAKIVYALLAAGAGLGFGWYVWHKGCCHNKTRSNVNECHWNDSEGWHRKYHTVDKGSGPNGETRIYLVPNQSPMNDVD
jgi:hypothetical protein